MVWLNAGVSQRGPVTGGPGSLSIARSTAVVDRCYHVVMRTLLLATGNAKKGKELAEICGDAFTVLTLSMVGLADFDVVEDAPDFIGNAKKKALATKAAVVAAGNIHHVDVVLADDSGLCVDALDGHPGVRSARFSKDAGYAPAGLAVDAANNRLLLALLGTIPLERRGAYFVSVVAAVGIAGDDVITAEGRVHGRIAADEFGGGGFGYDPLFIVDDDAAAELSGQRMAALTSSQKHGISHRGRALKELVPQLDRLCPTG